MKTAYAALLAACLANGPAMANDTSAELAAGGLILTRNDTITMASEDLYISPSAVRVRYSFVNTSPRDVTIRVAFPMPDIGGPGFFQSDVSIPVVDPANILGFSTKVDGAPVRASVEQKALVGKVDHASWLRANQIPLAVHQGGAQEAFERLSSAKQREAVKLGLFDEDLEPVWVLRTTYHWLQTFPAGRPISIEHRYTPSVGATVGTGLGSSYGSETAQKYCVDKALMTTLARSAATHDGSPRYTENWIDYILVTGGNWKHPIGDFRLVVDKGARQNLVSFCADGVKKIGPTQFEVRRTNWRPEKDLSILFLVPPS